MVSLLSRNFKSNFEALGLLPELIEAVEEMGWTLPTGVQDEAIPLILGGGDVMIAAETGSGKTGAFCLPILQNLYEHLRGDANVNQTVVLQNTAAGDAGSSGSAAAGDLTSAFKMSPTDRDPICAVDAEGLLVQTRHPQNWAGVRATLGVNLAGAAAVGKKYMFEATVTDEGLCRVGWSVISASRNLGTEATSFGYGGTGKKSSGNKFEDYGEPFALHDVIGCMVEVANNGNVNISYAKNGKLLGLAFSVPAASTVTSSGLFPTVVLKNAEMKFNFGGANSAFKYPIAGFVALQTISQEEKIIPAAGASSSSSSSSSTPAPASSPSNKNSNNKVASASGSTANNGSPFALILEPTRELALQVGEELQKFKSHLHNPPIYHEVFVGGSDQNQFLRALQKGLHIIIATPGRLIELVKSKKLDVSNTRNLVLDEADQLIVDAGTKADLLFLYDQLPKTNKAFQSLICSATLHSDAIQDLAAKVTQNATWVDLKGVDSVPDSVDHVVVVADPLEDRSWQAGKTSSLQTDGVHAGINLRSEPVAANGARNDAVISEGVKILKPKILLEIIDQFKMDQCMIFVRTQVDCDNLETFLLAAGGCSQKFTEKKESGKENIYSCVVLHGGRPPQERSRNFEAFKSGDVRFLICTDVAARGIDIKNLPYVINLCLPDKEETYIHRIGRVGRADAVGLAISVVAAKECKEKVWYHTCNSKDRGRSCTRTQLTTQGGCTIWMDEYDMLTKIEKRLNDTSIPILQRNNLAMGASQIVQLASKNRKPVDDGSLLATQHVNVLRPTVEELVRLEVSAQNTFWNVKLNNKWASMLK